MRQGPGNGVLDDLIETLLERRPPGWSLRKAERALGSLIVLRACGADWAGYSASQRARRLAEVRWLASDDRSAWEPYPGGRR